MFRLTFEASLTNCSFCHFPIDFIFWMFPINAENEHTALFTHEQASMPFMFFMWDTNHQIAIQTRTGHNIPLKQLSKILIWQLSQTELKGNTCSKKLTKYDFSPLFLTWEQKGVAELLRQMHQPYMSAYKNEAFIFWRTRTLTPVHTSARVNEQLLC